MEEDGRPSQRCLNATRIDTHFVDQRGAQHRVLAILETYLPFPKNNDAKSPTSSTGDRHIFLQQQ